MSRTLVIAIASAGIACASMSCSVAYADGDDEGGPGPPPPFELAGLSIGGARSGHATAAWETSFRIAALPDGALVIDADSGMLLRTDAIGKAVAQLAIGANAGLLAFDPVGHLAFVADRAKDRIVVVDTETFAAVRMWKTPAEPYGVALTPDRATVLVTAIADRVAIAYDAATGRERWRSEVDAEPRGIAIAADGKHAVVATLTSGAIDQLDLATRTMRRVALPIEHTRQFARGAFAATYLGDHLIASPFQLEMPAPVVDEVPSSYGGSFNPPLAHALAFVDGRGRTARGVINVNEPRAVAWDPAHDSLYLAGLATDSIVQVTHASQVDVALGDVGSVGGPERCGADGLAIAANGDVLVWCSFTRKVARLRVGAELTTKMGPESVASSLPADAHQGYVRFHTADSNISAHSAMSCGNCHLDGRSDGLSWRIHGTELQTPMLAGRLVGTAPFKWDGSAKTLTTSLRSTIERLGGNGLSKKHLAALVSYLESTAPVRTPTRDRAAVARGKQLFESAELGCASCHDGAVYTDNERHAIGTTRALDTPSLIGLAASAPYFHDGSAPTLDALLRDRGNVHGMATDGTTKLGEAALADLRAYLETR